MNYKKGVFWSVLVFLSAMLANYGIGLIIHDELALVIVIGIVRIFVTFCIIAAGLIFVIAGLRFSRKRDNYKKQFTAGMILLWIAISWFISANLLGRYFPNSIQKKNAEINKVEIDERIPKEDLRAIRILVKGSSDIKTKNILTLKYYEDCERDKKEGERLFLRKSSEKCQPGDILLEVGYGSYCGPLCGHGENYFYLLRKTGQKWEVIENLGGSQWIS